MSCEGVASRLVVPRLLAAASQLPSLRSSAVGVGGAGKPEERPLVQAPGGVRIATHVDVADPAQPCTV